MASAIGQPTKIEIINQSTIVRERPYDAESILRMYLAHLPHVANRFGDCFDKHEMPLTQQQAIAPELAALSCVVGTADRGIPPELRSDVALGPAAGRNSWPTGVSRAQEHMHAGKARLTLSDENPPAAAATARMDATAQTYSGCHAAFRQAAIGMALVDLEGNFLSVNPAFCDFVGCSENELRSCSAAAVVAPENRARHETLLGQLLAGQCSLQKSERLFVQKDGSGKWGCLSITLVNDSYARPSGFLYQLENISERKWAQEAEQLAALIYQNSSESMMVTDANHLIVSVNAAFTDLTGYSPQEVIGKNPRILSSGRHDKAYYKTMWDCVNSTGHWEGEIWNRHKNGDIFVAWMSITVCLNKDGAVHRRLALFSDITNRKLSEELIWHQANFDALTLLPNRRLFHDHLQQQLKKANRSGLPMALIFLDLDRFKEINDTMGHDKGDQLLKEAALRLKSSVRETDIVARLGGDEFTIILGELNEAGDVTRIAQAILSKMAAPFELGIEQAFVSASIGITLYPQDAPHVDSLLKNADQAMYGAKHAGGNCFRYFTPSMQQIANSRICLANDLQHALTNRQIFIEYEAIARLGTGEVCQAEAKLCWRHPEKGLVNSTEFLAVAQSTGMIMPIGDWSFRQAAYQATRWHKIKDRFQISVNISAVQLRGCQDNAAAWFDFLEKLGLPCRTMGLTLTENVLLEGGNRVNEQLYALQRAGIRMAVNHFGCGYSSMAHLKKFAIEHIKIDPSLVAALEPESDELAICEAIIAMAHKLGIKVIAEGVNTPLQRALLLNAGCDFGQGRLFTMPAILLHELQSSGLSHDLAP